MKLLTAYQLAQAIAKSPNGKEVRFFTDDVRHLYPWQRPRESHIIVKTRFFGDDMIMVSRENGTGTKLVSVSELTDPVFAGRVVTGITSFLLAYLQQFNVQRVAVL